MAYNYYQPMGYQMYGAPQMQQMQNGSQIQPQIQPAQQASIIWVDGYNEAAMYPVAPNAAVALWDKAAPAIYLKRADATGKPSMQIYDLVERKEPPKSTAGAEPQYATHAELTRLSRVVDELREGLEEMRLKTHSGALNEVTNNE